MKSYHRLYASKQFRIAMPAAISASSLTTRKVTTMQPEQTREETPRLNRFRNLLYPIKAEKKILDMLKTL